jgi:hypothetical protein
VAMDSSLDLEKQPESKQSNEPASTLHATPPEETAVSERPGARVGLSVIQFWVVLFGCVNAIPT